MDADKWKELFCAIQLGKGNAFLQSSLNAGLDVNALNDKGITLLNYAAECGNLKAIDFLVKNGADGNVSNSDGSKPLHIAAKFGHIYIVKFFLDLGVPVDSFDRDNCTPLHYVAGKRYIPLAVRESCQQLACFLVESNANLNAVNRKGFTPMLLAAREGNKEMVELFMKLGADVECCDERQWTVLHYASKKGWPGIVRNLVGKRLDLNAKCSLGTALIIAADSSNEDVVELLIDSGADIESQGFENWTVLYYACEEGWLEVVKSLVNKGCNLHAKSTCGNTPLLLAAMREHSDVVEYLIESGADVENRDNEERTVLHYACELGWLDVLTSLIEKGCNLNAQDFNCDTPLHVAVKAGDLEVIERLLQAGADYNVENDYNTTAFNNFIRSYSCIEGITIFLENGAFFQSEEYDLIYKDSVLKEGILKNARLCTQAVINKFNNSDLPQMYEIPEVSDGLPAIEKLKIARNSNVAQDITRSVEFEIQTKEYCHVLDARHITLTILCLRSLIEHYLRRGTSRQTR